VLVVGCGVCVLGYVVDLVYDAFQSCHRWSSGQLACNSVEWNIEQT